jgi:hypothetical protein
VLRAFHNSNLKGSREMLMCIRWFEVKELSM